MFKGIQRHISYNIFCRGMVGYLKSSVSRTFDVRKHAFQATQTISNGEGFYKPFKVIFQKYFYLHFGWIKNNHLNICSISGT